MHIPELEKALTKLAFLKPGEVLILAKIMVGSLDVTVPERAVNAIKRLVGRAVPDCERPPVERKLG
jgi:hypothetical protein